MRRDVAQPLEQRQREVGRGNLVCEALAQEAGQLVLMLERIAAGHHSARAVTEKEQRQARLGRLDERYEAMQVSHELVELVDVVALAHGLAVAPQIHRVYGEPLIPQLLGRPLIEAAMCLEAVLEDGHGTRSPLR